MALVTVPGGLYLPSINFYGGANPTWRVSESTLDAAADRVAFIFRAPKAGNIQKVGFRVGTVVKGADTTLIYSLQTIDAASGNPDGTEDETATIAVGDIVSDTMILSGNLSAVRAVTLGEMICAVVRFGVFNAGDSVPIGTLNEGVRQSDDYFGYLAVNLTGAYGRATASIAAVEIVYDDGSYAWIPASEPYSAVGTDAYNNTSTPDEIGLRFQIPFPATLAGCWLNIDADGDFNINFYTAAAKTALVAQDKDNRGGTSAMSSSLMFTTRTALAANTTYVLSVEPSSATNVTLSNVSVRAAAVMDQLVGGQAWQYATAKDPAVAGDFALTTTKRPVMGLIFSQVDDGVSAGGGLIVHPGMTGRVNG